MNVTGVGVTSSLVVQSLGDMRSTLADLQRQLGTIRSHHPEYLTD